MAYTNLLAADKNYILIENIEASYTTEWNDGAGFNPIGYYNDLNDNAAFNGIFDGGGFTLSTLTINRVNSNYIGVFSHHRGTIKDITVDSVDITGKDWVAGLVGENLGTIENSNASGSVSGGVYVGGLVGQNNNRTITDSTFDGSVVGTNSVGGLVGYNFGKTISNSSSSGSVVGNDNVGGLVGNNYVSNNDRYSGDTWCNNQPDDEPLEETLVPPE